MRAINGWVFIERDEQADTHCDLLISDKAKIKSMVGRVAVVEDGLSVSKGDRVHIPHYQVMDVFVAGTEYAVVKAGTLFAIEREGIFHPINGYVKVLKCVNDHLRGESGEVVIYQTENFIEKTRIVEILALAEDCKSIPSDRIGDFCHAPESDERLQRLLYTKEYMVHEDLIEFTTPGE